MIPIVFKKRPIPHARGTYYFYVPKVFADYISPEEEYTVIITDEDLDPARVIECAIDETKGRQMVRVYRTHGVVLGVMCNNRLLFQYPPDPEIQQEITELLRDVDEMPVGLFLHTLLVRLKKVKDEVVRRNLLYTMRKVVEWCLL